jgi:hypothetical protein
MTLFVPPPFTPSPRGDLGDVAENMFSGDVAENMFSGDVAENICDVAENISEAPRPVGSAVRGELNAGVCLAMVLKFVVASLV